MQNIPSLLSLYAGREDVLQEELLTQYGAPVMQTSIEILKTKDASSIDKFPFLDTWYPVAFDKFTDKNNPTQISILNKALVLFYDPVVNGCNFHRRIDDT